ncbi:ankyrin repeat and BTB/POZ domain-containing protein 2-like isoform X2 [Montipora capricornis]|uniref:ankyrin repeat and BTB/POZ domain-containing protein 2-like isoform X2 n=1 Tax=Montipora capricornis TaxID=246305 RepID=UPI0035F1CB1A
MAQGNLPANSHFLSTAAPKEDHNVNSTRNGAQSTTINTDWDVWLPMLPPLDELPWTLQDISKVLRLGRTRETFRAITPQAVERVSFLLQRPLLRIVLEARRLSILHSKCSRHEMQTSIRLVLSLSLAKSCLSLASKALSLYNTSSDRFRRSKRTRSGLILPVGKMFRWLVKIKVASRIYDAGVIYLSACLEYVAEELVYRAVTKQGLDQVTPEVLEEWINTDADFWGIFQPYYHLLSGRTAFGITDSIDVYAVSKNVKSSPSTGSSIRQGLDKALATTCVTSMNDLRDLVLRAQELFAGVYQSKDNKFISQVDWIPSALHTLFYFVKWLQQVGEDTSDILAATRRSHSHLPPLVEWLKVSSLHTKHRVSAFVDDDDVRQAARLLLPFNDCGPRFLGESLWGSKSLSSAATISSFQQDVSLRMLSCGRSDIIPQALAMLGSKNINDINAQGMTLLMYACANGNEALVTTLIEHHASLDLEVPNNQKIYPSLNLELKSWTALCFATTKGHLSICQILLDSGASPNGATDYRRDNQVETPLQLASAAGDFELVSLLLKKGADPYISVNTASLSPGLRGFGNAFAAAAAHGHKDILRKLLAESDERRDTDLLSLTEILYEETLKDEEKPGKLTKRQKAALEEALYHSCEHGYLDITMELRSLGVPWNIHCWSRTVGHAYETGQKSFLRSLLSDFQSMSADEYTKDFCDDGVVILFNIFKECEDLAISKELASVLSCCFGSEPLQEIMDLPVMETGIRIGADYINSAEMSDVTFLVEGRPFYAHKIILATASKRFKAMLSDMPLESKDGSSPCIEISDIKYETFTLVIQFLYSGKMDQPSLQSTILELLQASEFFMLDSLKRRCERLAADHLVCETVLDTYTFAKLCNAKELVSFCEAFMLRNLASMMDVRTFKDALIDNSGKDLFAALKSCLVQRIYSRNTSKTSFKV